MVTRKELAIFLSRLELFDRPKIKLEQYPTDSEVASNVLWKACDYGLIEDKVILDPGCGPGILGIGAMLLGAKHIIFVDVDKDVRQLVEKNVKYLKDNYEGEFSYEFVRSDISEFSKKCDLVLMNPPFGTKIKHIDKIFLESAINSSDKIISMHKTTTRKFIDSFCKDKKLNIVWEMNVKFPLKSTMDMHTKRIERIDVTVFYFERC